MSAATGAEREGGRGIRLAAWAVAMPPHILVLYGTTHGQSRKIASAVATSLRAEGATVTLANVNEAWSDDPRDSTAVVVVAPVHAGRFPGGVRQWVRRHRMALDSRPAAFVAVCLAIVHRTPKVDQDLRAVLDRFSTETGWRPRETKIVAGALKFTKYGWLTRWMMKRIVAKAGGDVDTSRDFEYTDWEDLHDFSVRFLRQFNPARPQPIDTRGSGSALPESLVET